MSEIVAFTQEQFSALLEKVGSRPESSGLGAPRVAGIGCGDGGMGPLASGVYAMLAAGSPRLALAKAYGVPLAPYLINVRAIFPDTSTADIPETGADVKIVQDTLIDALVCRVVNESSTANVNQFQTMSDFFFGFQGGLEATLDVQGAPRYSVAPKFTPISTLADMVNGTSKWPGGWVLTYQQQIMMSFRTTITLPYAPIEVVCTYRGWVPTNEMFVHMSNREALQRLAECGFALEDNFCQRTLLNGGR